MVLVGLATLATAQDAFNPTSTFVSVPGSEPRERVVDFDRMDVAVSFRPAEGIVAGRVVHTFRVLRESVDSLVFDAVKIRIKQATLNGEPARIAQTDSTVVVFCEPALKWDSTGTIAFTYEATPQKGLYFIGWDDPSGRMRKQIWTQGQAFDNRYWIPMYDEMNDKMLTSVAITVDSTYTAISNGVLVNTVANTNGTKTWSYAITKPHSTYLVMLAVGEFDKTVKYGKNGVPIELYSYPDRPDQIEPTYKMTVEAMDFLDKELGVIYPWSVYRQVPVADFIYGAMENTTATIFGDFYMANEREWLDRSYVRTNVHELTHQWFGDLITGRSRKSLWLQESFATFYPHLLLQETDGEDAYEWSRREMQNEALKAGRVDRKPIVHPNAGGSRYYPKGACVIDMMRSQFGEESVRRVITHYLNKHAFGSVETNDLYLAFQDALGLAPDWFFDQWLYKGGEPAFLVESSRSISGNLEGDISTTTVEILQIHAVDQLTGYFRMPVDIDVFYTDGTSNRQNVEIKSQYTRVSIPNPDNKIVAFVLFDPGSTILKDITFAKSFDELVAQVKMAPHMIDRYDALVELSKDSAHDMELLDIVEQVLEDETFYAMRSKAVLLALRLARSGVSHAYMSVERGLEDPSVEVRKATLKALTTIPPRLKPAVVDRLSDDSYEIISIALQSLGHDYPEGSGQYLKLTQGLTSPFARVEIERLVIRTHDGDSSALRELADLAGPGYEFWTRGNAMSAFGRLGQLTPDAAKAMIEAVGSRNSRLAGSATAALKTLVTQGKWKRLVQDVSNSLTMEPSHHKAVEAILH